MPGDLNVGCLGLTQYLTTKIHAKTPHSNDHGNPNRRPRSARLPRNNFPGARHPQSLAERSELPAMSYKKDEDAGEAIVKVDRTAVYQEGMHST